MKASPFDVAYLFDFYADILTDKQRDYLDLYHNQDLSLSEIAENEGITRQGVRDVIARAEGVLRHMEEKLGLVARYSRVARDMEQVLTLAQEILSINERKYDNTDIQVRGEQICTLTRPLVRHDE